MSKCFIDSNTEAETLEYLWMPCLDSLFWREEQTDAASGWWGHVPFAHWIIGAGKPRVFVELGTHHGVSYYAFCEAVLRNKLDTRCYAVDTWKGDDQAGQYGEEVYSRFRRIHDERFSSFSKPLRCTFDEALQYMSDDCIDLLHIDGFHTYEAVRHDFEAWRPKLSERAVVLFHDTNVREGNFGVWRLWEELQEEYSCFEFLHGHGLGVLAFGRAVASPIATLCSLADSVRITAIRERFSFLGEHSILVNRCWNVQNENELRQRESATIAKTADEYRVAAEQQVQQLSLQLSAINEARSGAEKARSVTEEQVQQLSLQLSAINEARSAAEKARSVAEEQVQQITLELGAAHEARIASEEVARQAVLRRDQMLRSLTWRAALPFHQLAARFPLWMRTPIYNLLVSVFQLPPRIRQSFWKPTTWLNGRRSSASVEAQVSNIRPLANVPV